VSMMDDVDERQEQGHKGGAATHGSIRSSQINEDHAPQNQLTEGPDEMPGIGSDLKPNNGSPIPAEGLESHS
jgi:hypothetical protein